MTKIREIIQEVQKGKRKEVEETLKACMKAVCCDSEKVLQFEVYDSSINMVKRIIEKMQNEFLIVIADYSKQEPERKVIIYCNETKEKEDEIFFVKKNKTEVHAIINLSKGTSKFLKEE